MIAPRRNLAGCLIAALLSTGSPVSEAQECPPAAGMTHSMHAGSPAAAAATGEEARFLAANDVAMNAMMDAMTVSPTGDIDRDFVAMMVPHHQGAIDMAQLVLRFGANEQIRRLAQEIIVTQQQEIAAMRLAVGEALPPSAPSPTQTPASVTAPAQALPGSAMHSHHAPVDMK